MRDSSKWFGFRFCLKFSSSAVIWSTVRRGRREPGVSWARMVPVNIMELSPGAGTRTGCDIARADTRKLRDATWPKLYGFSRYGSSSWIYVRRISFAVTTNLDLTSYNSALTVINPLSSLAALLVEEADSGDNHVIYQFNKRGEFLLQLVIGDTVVINEESEDWYMGYSTKNKAEVGIFPKNYINATEFVKIQEMIHDLLRWRKEILSRKITTEQMKDLKQKVAAKIDIGNAALGLDLVHVEVADRLKKEMQGGLDLTMETKEQVGTVYNLYVLLHNFVCRVDDTEILVNLYDAVSNNENYIIKWEKEKLGDSEFLNSNKVVFTDLDAKDRNLEKVFIVFQIVRYGVMEHKDSDDRKQTRGLRRPFGAAAMDITDILQVKSTGTVLSELDEEFVPFLQCGDKEFMDSCVKKVVADSRGFPPHGTTKHGDVRNDIYVTIMEGEFNRGAKTADKNVEITMFLCNKSGQTLEVAVSTEAEFRGLHLKFLFKHKSRNESKDKNEKAFAMAFVKLLNKNGTTLQDGDHDLLLYKVPLFSGPYSLSYRDSFKISTYVCSTKLTHNVDLLGLLRWQEVMNDQTQLKKHLEALMRVDGEEIVKDLLDSLFYILMQNTVSDLYDSLVFDALVYIIGLVADSRYFQFRPILNAYIHKLMVILKEYVDNANEDTEHEPSFRQAMKSLEYIFKFIIRSRELFAIHLFVEFLDHVPPNRLKIQKIKCIEDLVQTPLFSMQECREVMLPMMLGHIRDLMEAQDEMSACIKVLSHIMDTLFTPNKPGDCVAVLLNILRQMTETHYNHYITKFTLPTDLEDFLMEIMMLFQTLIQEQLWNNFFHCAIAFLTQPHLQLENFSSTKRNKIISQYGDMRREMGFEIRDMWISLGPNKIAFIPEMVGPLLEMTLIPETEMRKATLPIFYDMMMCEFNHPVRGGGIKGNFKDVETEMINQMDALVEGGRGDEQYMQLFKDTLFQACNQSEKLRKPGLEFVEMVSKLLQRLLEYRHIIQDEIKDHRMSCIVNLLDFYNEIGRREMYVRYLHKLSAMHLECDNYTEAAYTLMLYANLLTWSKDPLPVILESERFPDARTHQELKEMLYHHVINYFEKGKMWEMGIELCQEIARIYENDLFDYEKLSFILNKVLIYRGKEYERLQDFSGRMQTLFPNAENIWQEKTNLITGSTLPGILCWFPVTETFVYKVSPIETAIETLTSSNKKLSSAIEHQLSEQNARADQLGMLLKGIVDAAVNGGISNWKHFYADDFAKNERDTEFNIQLKEATKHQAVLIKDGMYVHKRKVAEVQKPFHAYLEEKYVEWIDMIEREYNIKVKEKTSTTSTLKKYHSMSQSALSLDRLSSMYPNNAGHSGVGGSMTNVSSSPSIAITPSPNTKAMASRSQSVWSKSGGAEKILPRKGLQSKVNRRGKGISQISNTSSSDSLDSNRNSSDHPIELSEQITPRRPPRPDAEKERRNSQQRLSQQFSQLSHLPENGTAGEEEEPPPLPDKQSHDHLDVGSPDPPPIPSRVSAPQRTPRRSRV
ncbi:DOCK2-like protein [Mya arenaria]|uniref:DOCK2-like protein n=1 Tax=Mya arenaria TaxID=6604 RepID=A0ABY7FQP4_MYAAR|nr:DOCK2-like protein [Mya arenaria]